ncbi:DNA methylase N-4/N-6 [Candidatus Nanopelagicaceae bacterium]
MPDQPEKLDIETTPPNVNVLEKLKTILPGVFADGIVDAQRIADLVGFPLASVRDGKERFGLSWAQKKEAVQALLIPSMATLAPDSDASVNWDNAENIFIEGDNLEVLKLLQKSYNDQVKLIYIDPPYNTGNDFVYNDDFNEPVRHYLEVTGQVDSEGNRLVANTDTSGRKSSKWLSMMYPRIKLAHNLLKDDGAIFISIDDNEVHHLRLLLNEIFGPENFIAQLIWKSKSGGANDSAYFAIDHEYIICYARNAKAYKLNLDKEAEVTTSYPLSDENGKYALERLDKQNLQYSKSMDYEITGPDGLTYKLEHRTPGKPNATWRWGKGTVQARMNELVFKEGKIYTKNYKKEGAIPRSLLIEERFGRTRTGSTEVNELLNANYFDNPKPTKLIRHLVRIGSNEGDIVLDFFGGSGTTAHAVLLENSQALEKRKYILVSIPEETAEKSRAREDGILQITEIAKLRIKSAMAEIKNSEIQGLRWLKLSQSCFLSGVSEDKNGQLTLNANTLVSDVDPDALATEIFLKSGIRLDQEWVRIKIGEGEAVYCGGLVAYLSKVITKDLFNQLKNIESAHTFVFLEDAFAGLDAEKVNLHFAFKQANLVMKTI